MSFEGSYNVQQISKDIDLELSRLKAQVALFWDKELKRYIEFGLEDGMSIVEFGSGPGYLTEKILRVFPNCNITGLEIDPYLVGVAKKHLETSGLKNWNVLQGSIAKTELASNTFDFSITRLVFEHLPEPLPAAQEVHRVLKPGGKAILVDNDFEMHLNTYPHIPKLRELYDAFCQSQFDKGGNPKIGRELPLLLKRAGFSNIDFEVIAVHSEILGFDAFLGSEGIGIPTQLIKEGYLTGKTLGKISTSWRNLIKNESHAIVRQLFMAVGEK